MVKITLWTDTHRVEIVVNTDSEALELQRKIRSQMSNGHTVLFGDNLVNPKYIRLVGFERVQEVNNDSKI
ncbi:hypothetical protein EAF07_08130 [Streptococcus hillyeri]|uniref:Uncharacterized protein n=1 Tax=Streptococcus hillyeri TaxID=2282420 RepID=A0A3L9DQ87_9STRE|nr:hypothetical protein EAF07_08130 [Streptococcus hillyeri]